MRYALRLFFAACALAVMLAVQMGAAYAADGWYWLSSDDKYSKFYDPSSVVVTHTAPTSRGKIATEIAAWTKTSYSYEGAKETIDAYGLKAVIPDPSQFAYSLAEIVINPQNRTLQYAKEEFCDASGKVLWSHADGRAKEITSQEFDEGFYDAVVDQVFAIGEAKRAKADDRWITLWDSVAPDGTRMHVTGDTTTMRMKGENLIFWKWAETKDSAGHVMEIQFQKAAVNLPQGTERIIKGTRWTPASGWKDLDDDMDGAYRMIPPTSVAYKGIEKLRAYAAGYSMWLNRYSIED